MEVSNKTCHKCGKEFRAPALLKRHLENKTPCDPIVDAAGKDNACRYCGKQFASRPSMRRHTKQYCKIANSDEGMEKLMEYTMQRQLAEMETRQNAKIDRLTALVEKMTTGPPAAAAPAAQQIVQPIQHAGHVNNGPVTNNAITINAWSSEDRIIISAGMLRAAFTENARLAEYCRLTDEDKTDAVKAEPYVIEALMELVKRAHADPSGRNVHINPRRADQVMVFDEATWKVITLAEGIRALFDGVAGNIHRIIVTNQEREKIPLEIQASASWIPNMYENEPDRYITAAKAPMMAHLVNTAPAKQLA
jgi:hypothetical protein